MALPRVAAPLFTTTPSFRTQLSRQSNICQRCLRQLQQQPSLPSSPKRFLGSTSVRYQALAQHQPPRNADIPETSIAGGNERVDRKQNVAEDRLGRTPPPPPSQTPVISEPESEAQKPKSTHNSRGAVGSVATPDPSPSEGKPRRSKLRPRKAALSLSPTAVTQLQDLLNQPDPKLIRVGVKNRGCSGLAYHLEYVDKPGAFDEAVEQDGVKVLIDSKALFSIIGSEMDWVEDKLSRRFVFKNPNITEQCGCGESFSIS